MTFRLFTASAAIEQQPTQAEQILWSALGSLEDATALNLGPEEHGTGVLLQHIEQTDRQA
jgi:hypothetical protein